MIAQTASMCMRTSTVMVDTFRARGSVVVRSRSPDRSVRCGAYRAACRNQTLGAQRPGQHQKCLACLGVRQVASDRSSARNGRVDRATMDWMLTAKGTLMLFFMIPSIVLAPFLSSRSLRRKRPVAAAVGGCR